jgi:hypothetical protein
MSKYRTFLRHRILIPVNRRKQITHFDAFDLCLADQKCASRQAYAWLSNYMCRFIKGCWYHMED